MRQSLLHSHNKSEILSLMIKEAKKHNDERDVIKVDIPFEEWDKGDCVTIYIT
jgi:hypothetical protein